MNKFKVGDRVVCTRMERPPYGIDLKKSYIVTGIDEDNDGFQWTLFLEGVNGEFVTRDFQITHQEAVGDNPPEKGQMKPKVDLIDYTGAGYIDKVGAANYALSILLFAKDTRLEMSPEGLAEKLRMPYEDKLKQLEYVVNTIPSSWEFVDLTFMIRNVTRAFTHQLVRTRLASYAQQTMRTLDVNGWDYATGPTIAASEPASGVYDGVMEEIAKGYKTLIDAGIKPEDARGILPTNIGTNIVMKLNLRTFIDLVRKRGSLRVQDEYRQVVQQMTSEALRVYPWLQEFLNRGPDKAMADLENLIGNALPEPHRTSALKMLMQVRGY